MGARIAASGSTVPAERPVNPRLGVVTRSVDRVPLLVRFENVAKPLPAEAGCMVDIR